MIALHVPSILPSLSLSVGNEPTDIFMDLFSSEPFRSGSIGFDGCMFFPSGISDSWESILLAGLREKEGGCVRLYVCV